MSQRDPKRSRVSFGHVEKQLFDTDGDNVATFRSPEVTALSPLLETPGIRGMTDEDLTVDGFSLARLLDSAQKKRSGFLMEDSPPQAEPALARQAIHRTTPERSGAVTSGSVSLVDHRGSPGMSSSCMEMSDIKQPSFASMVTPVHIAFCPDMVPPPREDEELSESLSLENTAELTGRLCPPTLVTLAERAGLLAAESEMPPPALLLTEVPVSTSELSYAKLPKPVLHDAQKTDDDDDGIIGDALEDYQMQGVLRKSYRGGTPTREGLAIVSPPSARTDCSSGGPTKTVNMDSLLFSARRDSLDDALGHDIKCSDPPEACYPLFIEHVTSELPPHRLSAAMSQGSLSPDKTLEEKSIDWGSMRLGLNETIPPRPVSVVPISAAGLKVASGPRFGEPGAARDEVDATEQDMDSEPMTEHLLPTNSTLIGIHCGSSSFETSGMQWDDFLAQCNIRAFENEDALRAALHKKVSMLFCASGVEKPHPHPGVEKAREIFSQRRLEILTRFSDEVKRHVEFQIQQYGASVQQFNNTRICAPSVLELQQAIAGSDDLKTFQEQIAQMNHGCLRRAELKWADFERQTLLNDLALASQEHTKAVEKIQSDEVGLHQKLEDLRLKVRRVQDQGAAEAHSQMFDRHRLRAGQIAAPEAHNHHLRQLNDMYESTQHENKLMRQKYEAAEAEQEGVKREISELDQKHLSLTAELRRLEEAKVVARRRLMKERVAKMDRERQRTCRTCVPIPIPEGSSWACPLQLRGGSIVDVRQEKTGHIGSSSASGGSGSGSGRVSVLFEPRPSRNFSHPLVELKLETVEEMLCHAWYQSLDACSLAPDAGDDLKVTLCRVELGRLLQKLDMAVLRVWELQRFLRFLSRDVPQLLEVSLELQRQGTLSDLTATPSPFLSLSALLLVVRSHEVATSSIPGQSFYIRHIGPINDGQAVDGTQVRLDFRAAFGSINEGWETVAVRKVNGRCDTEAIQKAVQRAAPKGMLQEVLAAAVAALKP